MNGLRSCGCGLASTPREQKLCSEIADLTQFVNDLLVILTYLIGESEYASTSSTGAARSTESRSQNDHLGHHGPNSDPGSGRLF